MDTAAEQPPVVRIPRKVQEALDKRQAAQPPPEDLHVFQSADQAIEHLAGQKERLRDPRILNAFPDMDIGALEQHYDEQITLLRQRAKEGGDYGHIMQLYNAAQKAVNEKSEELNKV